MSTDPLLGKQFGSYELKDLLGRGGMAAVYRGYQASIDRSVAVKVLPAELLFDPNFGARFFNEARTLARLTHPNILPLYDFGQANGMPYIVMPLMSNGTLADRLRSGPLALPEVVRVITAMAQALDFANQQGVLHRDVKPNNILFDQHDNPYLADFGIAKASESGASLTGTGIIGTPDYMSPEQARGDPLDHRSDLYSLAVVAYQAITGQTLFRATTPMGVIFKHVSEAPQPLRAMRPDLSEAVETVVLRALAKDPGARYNSASEFARALANAAAGAVEVTQPRTEINIAAPTADLDEAVEVPVAEPGLRLPTSSGTGPAPAAEPALRLPTSSGTGPAPAARPAAQPAKRGLNFWLVAGGGGLLVVCGLCAALVFGAALMDGGATGTATPEAAVLYQDDFTSQGGWEVGEDPDNRIAVENGELLMKVGELDTLLFTTAGQDLGSVRVEATVRSTGSPDGGFGMICHFEDADNFYLGGITADGRYAITRWLDNEATVLTDASGGRWQESANVPTGQASYRVALQCTDETLTLYVNGVEVASVLDANFTAGDIGVFTQSSDSAAAEAFFDDLRVTAAP